MTTPYLIAVAGGSGSGKTTFVELLAKALAAHNPLVIATDHYYKDLSHLTMAERTASNVDCPDAVELELLLWHVHDLRQGRAVERPCYDFATYTRGPATVRLAPAPILIVDGIFSLCDPRLNELTDLKIFIDVDEDVRLARRLQRDVASRGRSFDLILSQYFASVKPMHQRHIEPTKACADLILPWNRPAPRSVGMVADVVRARLANR